VILNLKAFFRRPRVKVRSTIVMFLCGGCVFVSMRHRIGHVLMDAHGAPAWGGDCHRCNGLKMTTRNPLLAFQTFGVIMEVPEWGKTSSYVLCITIHSSGISIMTPTVRYERRGARRSLFIRLHWWQSPLPGQHEDIVCPILWHIETNAFKIAIFSLHLVPTLPGGGYFGYS
jgi:hypothetical protein